MQSSTILSSSVVVAGKENTFSELGDEAVILDLKQSMYFGLDPVGTFIWQLVQEPVRVSDVYAAVLGCYNVDEDTCEREVLAFLNDLASEGLISVASDA